MGKTGQSIFTWYTNRNVTPFTYDDRQPTTIPWEEVNLVHPSPGVSQQHPIYQKAQELGIEIQSDAHIAQEFYPQHRYVGITGSNGKSTTTALLQHLVNSPETPALAAGNIGVPILEDIPTEPHTIIWELSSFQLDIGAPLTLEGAAFLNLTANHLDRHHTIEAYKAAKARIFTKAKWGLTGVDDLEPNCLLWREGREFEATENSIKVLDHTFELPKNLLGVHNHKNAAFALAMAIQLGTDTSVLNQRLQTFTGLPHRLEKCLETTLAGKKLTIINDSKATTTEAVISAFSALDSSSNIWWIAGGQIKTGGIETLHKWIPKLKGCYFIGDSAETFYNTAKRCGAQNVANSEFLNIAIDQALTDIQNSDVSQAILLFSPACPSFDQFKNFEDRGEQFKENIKSHHAILNSQDTICAA